MGFSDCPYCWPLGQTNWAPVLGRCQGLGHFTRLTFSLGLASGPTRLFFKPYQLPLCYSSFWVINAPPKQNTKLLCPLKPFSRFTTICLEAILFYINLDVMSYCKIFNTFDYVFFIDCIANLNQLIYLFSKKKIHTLVVTPHFPWVD